MKKGLTLGISLLLLSMVVSGVAFAEDGAVTTSAPKTIDVACVQNAVTTRESALQTAWSAFSVSMSNALINRGAALSASWGMTDGKARRESRNAAWSAYKKSAQEAAKTLRTAKKTAWDTFKSASKACKVPVVESENTMTSISL